MNELDYETFSKCRIQNFLVHKSEAFFKWIGAQCESPFLKYFSHLAYNEVRLIVESANRTLSENGKLHKLNAPLTVAQIKDSIEARVKQVEAIIYQYNKMSIFKDGAKHFIKE